MALTSSTSSPSATNRANESKDGGLQIFLGGSCNPTTWRQNVAIPYLEMNGISYYNPQVDNWTPAVVDSERYAKQNAKILLFVIDKQTRSTVSLVESAFMAGENKSMVLVIYPFDYNVFSLIDTSNCIESRGKLVKTEYIVNKNQNESSYSVKSSCPKQSSSTLIASSNPSTNKSNSTSTAIRSSSNALTSDRKIDTDVCKVNQRILESYHEETMHLKLSNEVISMGEFRELKQARHILQNLISMKEIPIFSDILQALKYISYSLDAGIDEQQSLSHHKYKLQNKMNENCLSLDLSNFEQSAFSVEILDQKFNDSNLKDEMIKDVYLSLDDDDRTSIESIVLPILQEKGLTYNYMSVDSISEFRFEQTKLTTMPKNTIDSQMSNYTRYSSLPDLSGNTKLAIEKEICAIRSSRVLLFVITNKCRGLSIMVLASHFMALFRNNVVLCVQYLEEPCSIGGEILTKTAIADYNRGRVYLCDYAMKSQVPVFSTIGEAIECCNRKCRYKNKS